MLSKLLQRLMPPNPRRCEEARALMSDYLDGELPKGERRGVERHVRFCPRCRSVLRNLRQTIGGLRALAGAPPSDVDAAAERVRGAWRKRV